MGASVLVFISHSSEDKETLIEPIVSDLEECYINTWLDKRKILPGDNLRKSIFKDGLDKADVALIFFTENSLKSSWVDKEIKHVLREEGKKGNNFDLNKIISIFDSKETYDQISERYPELTDDLLHLMPQNYNKTQLGQLISAIWSKYLSLQGGNVEVQKQILAKEKELFQKDKTILDLTQKLEKDKDKNSKSNLHDQFAEYVESGKISEFLGDKDLFLKAAFVNLRGDDKYTAAAAFGLIDMLSGGSAKLTIKGREFLSWYILNYESVQELETKRT